MRRDLLAFDGLLHQILAMIDSPVRRATGFVDFSGSHRNIVKSSLPDINLSESPPAPLLAFRYRSSAFFVLSSKVTGIFPVWSKAPVRMTKSVDRDIVFTQCA